MLHLLYKWDIIRSLWKDLVLFFENYIILLDVAPQAAFSDFLDVDLKLFLVQNYLILICKIYIYNSRRSESVILKFLIREIIKVENIEEKNFKKKKKKKKMKMTVS